MHEHPFWKQVPNGYLSLLYPSLLQVTFSSDSSTRLFGFDGVDLSCGCTGCTISCRIGVRSGDVYEASHCRMGLLILLVRNHFVLCLNCFFHWNVCQLAGGFKHFQTASWIGLWGSINVWRIMIWPNPIKSRTSTKTLHFFHHKPVQSASSGLFHPKTGWPWLANIFKINNQPVSTCGHCW